MKKSPSSICLAESAGSALDLNEPDLFGQSLSVSKTPTPSASSANTGPIRPFTTMSEPSTQMDLEELTSSVAGSPASRGPLPGSSEAQKMTAISGRKWLPLLKTYGLSGSLAKTCEALLTSQWGSSAAFLTWRGSGTAPSHLLFQLAPSMPRTAGTGSGLWPTAQAWDGKRGPRKPDGKRGMALSDLSAPRLWPTPTASDHKGSGPTVIRKDGKNRLNDRLDYATEQRAPNGGQLNPTWVEWLMGFPEGWTDLGPSATPSSRKSSRKSGGQSSQRSD